MLNSRTKDKIYAALSFLAIVLAIGSFALVVNFLLQINKYIFSVNDQIVKEKTTVMDKPGFESIKEKLKIKESNATGSAQTEILHNASANNISTPSSSFQLSPEPTASKTKTMDGKANIINSEITPAASPQE